MLADIDKRMTARQAAAYLNLTPGRIRQLAVDGTLAWEKFGPILTFLIADIQAYRQKRDEYTGEKRGPKSANHKG